MRPADRLLGGRTTALCASIGGCALLGERAVVEIVALMPRW
jgi:hypothetical protein